MDGRQSLTPHGEGFSFVDRVEEMDLTAERIVASKRLNGGMSFFKDHFPGNPLMPGVLLIEAGAQASGVLWAAIKQVSTGEATMLAQVKNFRLRAPVWPESTLRIVAKREKDFGVLCEFRVEIFVEKTCVAEGEIILARRGLA